MSAQWVSIPLNVACVGHGVKAEWYCVVDAMLVEIWSGSFAMDCIDAGRQDRKRSTIDLRLDGIMVAISPA